MFAYINRLDTDFLRNIYIFSFVQVSEYNRLTVIGVFKFLISKYFEIILLKVGLYESNWSKNK